MAEENKTLAQLVREVIAEDRSILGRKDDLINTLNPLVSAEQQRYYQALKRAIQDFNVAETMLLADSGSDEEKEAAKNIILQVQLEANVQEKRAQGVVETLVEALGWDDASVEEVLPEEEDLTGEKQEEEDDTSELEKSAGWVCPQCGKGGNLGKFCVQCGRTRDEDVTWTCPACGRENHKGTFCIMCGHAKGAPVPVQEAPKVSPQPVQPPTQSGQPSYRPPVPPANPNYPPPMKKNNTPIMAAVIGAVLILLLVFFGIKYSSNSNEAKQTNSQPGAATSQQSNVKTDLSLGGLELGLSIDDMRKLLGKEKESKAMDTPGYTRYYYDDIWVVVHDGKISALESNSSKVVTKRGMAQGSKISDVINAYGQASATSEYGGKDLYEYYYKSIDGTDGILRFAVNKGSDVVDYITIRENENKKKSSTTQSDAVNTFVRYHQAISQHQLGAAFAMLTQNMQRQMGSYESYNSGFVNTLTSEVTSTTVTASSPTSVSINYDLKARDRSGGAVYVQYFRGQATLVNIGGKWYIDNMSSSKTGDHYE